MLYTGVPLGIVNESRVSTAGDIIFYTILSLSLCDYFPVKLESTGEGDKMTKVITSAIDLRALLAALAPLSVQSADGTSTETKPEVINTIQVSSYSDALYSIEDLVSLFVDDFGADDFSQTGELFSFPDSKIFIISIIYHF